MWDQSDMLCDYDPQFQEPLARLREAASLVLLVQIFTLGTRSKNKYS
jgi:hypothetical protein